MLPFKGSVWPDSIIFFFSFLSLIKRPNSLWIESANTYCLCSQSLKQLIPLCLRKAGNTVWWMTRSFITMSMSPNNCSSTAKNSSPINTLFTRVTEKPPKHFFFCESHRQSTEVKKVLRDSKTHCWFWSPHRICWLEEEKKQNVSLFL